MCGTSASFCPLDLTVPTFQSDRSCFRRFEKIVHAFIKVGVRSGRWAVNVPPESRLLPIQQRTCRTSSDYSRARFISGRRPINNNQAVARYVTPMLGGFLLNAASLCVLDDFNSTAENGWDFFASRVLRFIGLLPTRSQKKTNRGIRFDFPAKVVIDGTPGKRINFGEDSSSAKVFIILPVL